MVATPDESVATGVAASARCTLTSSLNVTKAQDLSRPSFSRTDWPITVPYTLKIRCSSASVEPSLINADGMFPTQSVWAATRSSTAPIL